MSIGLCNAPVTFEKMMEIVWETFLLYIDEGEIYLRWYLLKK